MTLSAQDVRNLTTLELCGKIDCGDPQAIEMMAELDRRRDKDRLAIDRYCAAMR